MLTPDIQRKISAICRKIKSTRLEKGFSEEYMAQHLKTTPNIYSKLESAEIEIAVYRLIIICRVLELDLKELLSSQ